ncbi:MAG TPA: tetratricopeptide repeat protein [Terriglobales bacterium]|nr:tetratricopeptide repeat protein [Terriglobales bacterium]
MRFNRSISPILGAIFLLGAATCSFCAAPADTASENGKIPITTSSDEAKKEFQAGRALFEKLLAQDSIQHYDKAIALDPNFAIAELGRANSAPTAKDFFDHLKKAVSLADKVSEGERNVILANQAGANGRPAEQKQYLDKLAAAYPEDERVQFNLGGYYFGQQDYDEAIAHYKKATEISANYSPAYNLLGYAYRQAGDYSSAEEAFKKYVELIPSDPNPYDSYAELLLKMGRFDESIAQYRKALSIDPHFNNSHFGIAAGLMYQGKADAAASELQTMADQARNDGERRTAYFGMAVLASDTGNLEKALQAMDKEYAVAEKKNDAAAMAADLQAKGNIYSQMKRYDAAAQQFERSLQLVQASGLSQQIKENAKLLHRFNTTTLAIARKDLVSAKKNADEFRQGAEAQQNPAQLRQAHELTGRIALAEKDYDKAIAELEQANLQDPRNLYRLSEAYQAKGDAAKAQQYAKKTADFNSLPALNYAFVRSKVQKELSAKKM